MRNGYYLAWALVGYKFKWGGDDMLPGGEDSGLSKSSMGDDKWHKKLPCKCPLPPALGSVHYIMTTISNKSMKSIDIFPLKVLLAWAKEPMHLSQEQRSLSL
jgi:hypothetical protein